MSNIHRKHLLGEVIFFLNDINPSVLENGVMVVTLKGNINKHRNAKLLWSVSFLKLTKKWLIQMLLCQPYFVLNNKGTSFLTQQLSIPAL